MAGSLAAGCGVPIFAGVASRGRHISASPRTPLPHDVIRGTGRLLSSVTFGRKGLDGGFVADVADQGPAG